MGMKCFLLTRGRSQVMPLLLPTLNYTPEDPSRPGWWGSTWARWDQAKRHALGFSDLAYCFEMLPLLYCDASSSGAPAAALSEFWGMFFKGFGRLARLINTHVVLGSSVTFLGLTLFLRALLWACMVEDRHIALLWNRMLFFFLVVVMVSTISTALMATQFVGVYELVKGRVETDNRFCFIFDSRIVHW